MSDFRTWVAIASTCFIGTGACMPYRAYKLKAKLRAQNANDIVTLCNSEHVNPFPNMSPPHFITTDKCLQSALDSINAGVPIKQVIDSLTRAKRSGEVTIYEY